MYSYKTGLGQVWVGSKLPPNPANNIIWLRPSDDHRVLWEIRTYNIYKERWEVLTSAALTAEGLLVLIRDLEKDVKSLQELKVVLYDTVQDLTPEQQQIARQNIGAVSLEDLHLDENVTRLAIELTINDEKVYSVVTPLETLTEHYRKFLADPTKYVWQLYLKVGEDQLGLVPLFIITYGGLHIGFYSPDLSGETKYVSLNTNGDVVIRATVNNYGPTLVEVVQSTGDSTEKVMSQKAVTEELSKKASLESVTESISAHNTSTTAHADIRELLNTCVGLPAYDSSSYKITFTTLAGATVEIDLPIEQLALRYNAETESIEFDNADGTTTSIPVSAFVKEYVGSIGDRIQVSIDENNVIHATILKNSIDWGCLSFELQERINDHVTSADFATKAVRTDIAQTLSAAQQEQAWSNLGLDLVVLKFQEGATSVVLTDEEDAKLLAGAAVLLTVDGTNTGTGVHNADNHIFVSYNFTRVLEPRYYSLWSHTSVLFCSYKKASKTFVYNGSLQLNDTGALRFNRLTSLSGAQQSQAFENLGWKVHVISKSAIGSSDAVSDDEKEARLAATALLVQETGEMYIYGHNSTSTPSDRRFYRFRDTKTLALLNVVTTTGLITQPLFVNIYDENAVSFNIDQSSVSNDKKNKALGNIGIDFVRLPYSLLGTTLSDEMANVINNARGIILVDTPNDFILPTIYNKGRTTSSNAKFITIGETKDVYYILYNKNTKALANVVHTYTDSGCVRYVQEQNLTNTEKDTVLSNIGLDFVQVDYSLLGTTLTDEMFAVLDNAKGIILVDLPSNYYNPFVFIKGNNTSKGCIFVGFATGTMYCQIKLDKSTKILSNINTNLTYIGTVRYIEKQSLTDTQKQQARSNINAVGSSMIKGVEIVYGTAPMQEDNILYIELEETT